MDKSKKNFFKNTVSLYLMNIVKLIFPLLTIPYLTRTFSTEAYGVVTYVKALIVYVQLLIDFGFLLSATKEIVFAKGDKTKIGKITGDTLAEKTILAICSAIIYTLGTFIIPVMKKEFVFCMLYLVATIVTIFIFDFMFRGLEKMHLVAIPYIVSKTISTLLTFILVHGDGDIIFIPALELFGNGVAAIISCYFVKKLGIKISFSRPFKWIKDLQGSFVYFISNFATTVFGALTTVISGFFLSMSDIAYWGLCMQLLSAAKALYNPITNSLYPHMLLHKDTKFLKKINIAMAIPMVIGSILIMFYGNIIMGIIGGVKYTTNGLTLKLLLPAFICSFYSMIYGWPVLGVIGKEKETSMTTIMASIIQILGLGILFVSNHFELNGLAICCSLSESVLFIARYIVYRKNRFMFVK